MASITDFNTFIQWFQENDKPSEEQFANTLFSFRHKLDKIVIDDLHTEVLNKLNVRHRQINWVELQSLETVEANENRVVSSSYVVNGGTLQVKSSNTSLFMAGKHYYRQGTMQIAGDLVVKDGQVVVDGVLYVDGFLVGSNSTIIGNGIIY